MGQPKVEWECVLRWLPAILLDYENELSIVVCEPEHQKEYDELQQLCTRFNDLTDKEESKDTDPFELYGVDDEKKEITDRIIKIEMAMLDEAKAVRELYKDYLDED